MTPRKITLYDAFGPHPTKKGKIALKHAMEYAAKEQQKTLNKAAKIK